MVFIIAFSTFLTIAYLLLMVGLISALKRYQEANEVLAKELPSLSLIVPFRDEEQDLHRLFGSLERLDYPNNKLEVLLIDDHSTDNSLSMALQYAKSSSWQTKILSCSNDEGKKAALRIGVKEAQYEIVVQTDVDCSFNSGWLRCLVSQLTEDTVVISGPVATIAGSGIWSGFAALEYMSLQAVSAAFIKLNRPIMASGANLLFRKRIWNDELVRANKHSGDDTYLIQQAQQLGKVKFAMHEDAQVRTEAVGSLGSLINQRARWGGKSISYPSATARFLAFFIAGYYLLLLALVIISFFQPLAIVILLVSTLVKAVVDWPLLKTYALMTGQSKLMVHFYRAILLYPIYIIMTGAAILLGTAEWKGRKFNPLTE